MPLTLTAVHGVAHEDSSVGSAVLNTMQQVGGALGLATLSTIFVNNMGDKVAELTAKLPRAGRLPTKEQLAAAQKMIADEAFTYGASRAYLVAAIMIAVGGVVTLVALHVRHAGARDRRRCPGPHGLTPTPNRKSNPVRPRARRRGSPSCARTDLLCRVGPDGGPRDVPAGDGEPALDEGVLAAGRRRDRPTARRRRAPAPPSAA